MRVQEGYLPYKPTSSETKTIKKFTLCSVTRKDNYTCSLTAHFNYKNHVMYPIERTKTVQAKKKKKRALLKTDTLSYATIFHMRFNHLNCIILKVEVYFTMSDSI